MPWTWFKYAPVMLVLSACAPRGELRADRPAVPTGPTSTSEPATEPNGPPTSAPPSPPVALVGLTRREEADAAFNAACGTTNPARCTVPFDRKLWETAIVKNAALFHQAPGDLRTVELGLRVALAWTVLGSTNDARVVYERLIREQFDEARLASLEHGDAKRGVAADPEQYRLRVEYLALVLERVAELCASMLDFVGAGDVYEAIGRNPRLDATHRGPAIMGALRIFAALGFPDRVARLQKVAASAGLPASLRMEADWIAASLEYVAWDHLGADVGENRRHREAAAAPIRGFYDRYRDVQAAAPLLVESAFALSELKRATGDRDRRDWLKKVTDAWAIVATKTPVALRSQSVVDHASLAAYELIDDEIRTNFDGQSQSCAGALVVLTLPGHPGPTNPASQGPFIRAAAAADAYDARLFALSKAFVDAANASAWFERQGSLFDELVQCLVLAKLAPPPLTPTASLHRPSLLTIPTTQVANFEASNRLAVGAYARAIVVATNRSPIHAHLRIAQTVGTLGVSVVEGFVDSAHDPRSDRPLRWSAWMMTPPGFSLGTSSALLTALSVPIAPGL